MTAAIRPRPASTSERPALALCGINPPAIDHADPATGYDSSSGQRAYGQNTGGNDQRLVHRFVR